MSIPTIAWLTLGVRRQLEAYAEGEGMPIEEACGELVTDRLRMLGVPPADPPPPDIVTAQYRPMPENVIENLRTIYTNQNTSRGMAIHRNARKYGKSEGGKP